MNLRLELGSTHLRDDTTVPAVDYIQELARNLTVRRRFTNSRLIAGPQFGKAAIVVYFDLSSGHYVLG